VVSVVVSPVSPVSPVAESEVGPVVGVVVVPEADNEAVPSSSSLASPVSPSVGLVGSVSVTSGSLWEPVPEAVRVSPPLSPHAARRITREQATGDFRIATLSGGPAGLSNVRSAQCGARSWVG